MKIDEVEPNPELVSYVAMNLKPSDEREIAQYGLGYRPMIDMPKWARLPGTSVWMVGGEPVAIGGIHKRNPWLFTTPGIRRVRLSAHRIAREKIDEWTYARGKISNFVSLENEESIAWLQALGASFSSDTFKFSAVGGRFVEFWWY